MLFGVGESVEHHAVLALQTNALVAEQASEQHLLKQWAASAALQRELASTYSWIAPVDCSLEPCIALTFDDGPNPLTTPQIVGILEKEQVRATFFMVGSRVSGNEATLRRMYADGDEIGNHSWTHPNFTTLTPDQVRQQIAATQNVITAAGVPAPTLFRPPYGAVNKMVITHVPLTIMFWNEDPRDWAASTPQQVEQGVLSSARPGGVIDMHDIYQVTVSALDPTIQKLKSEHYQFLTVSQLMGLRPGQRGSYYGYKPSDFNFPTGH